MARHPQSSKSSTTNAEPNATAPRGLTAAARRALAEAESRRRHTEKPPAREIGGRDGPDPVRYGDWEVNGLASDF